MSAGKLDLKMEQGVTFLKTLVLKDALGAYININLCIFRGQIRESFASSTFVPFAFTIVNGAAGAVTMALTDAQTSTLKAGPKYVYDVEMVDASGSVTRIMQGTIKISPEVTR